MSQKIITIMQKYGQNSFIDLNNDESLMYLDELLDALKDNYLYINSEIYHVEKETMDVKLAVNNDLSLHVLG